MKTEYELKSIPNAPEYKNTVFKFIMNFFIPISLLISSMDLIEDDRTKQIFSEQVGELFDNG